MSCGRRSVVTAECERNVSALRRLKTYLRNSTGQERLLSLCTDACALPAQGGHEGCGHVFGPQSATYGFGEHFC